MSIKKGGIYLPLFVFLKTQYGSIPLFRQSRLYYWREYLHRWRYDSSDDLPC